MFFAAVAVLAASGMVVHPSSHQEAVVDAVRSVDEIELLQKPGCAERGRVVFFDRKRARCSGCHAIEGDEQLAGPNLWAVGTKYDKRDLFQAILKPSAEVQERYHVYILDTETHGLVVGVISSETDEEIVVHDETGGMIRLGAEEVFDVRKSDLSMMPDNIVETITTRELADLLEFLTTLRPDGPATSL